MRHATKAVELEASQYGTMCTCGYRTGPFTTMAEARRQANLHEWKQNAPDHGADPRQLEIPTEGPRKR